jgi:hypothetical protein
VETNEVENDSTATIIYNENGVLVKKKINETLVIEDVKKKTEIKTKK